MLRKNDVLLVDERKKVDKRLEKIIKDYDQELLYVHIRFNTFLRYAYFEILTAISKLYKYNNILNDLQNMIRLKIKGMQLLNSIKFGIIFPRKLHLR